MIVSPVSSAPRPSEPAGQCSTEAPSKCPPMRTIVDPGHGLDLVVEQLDPRGPALDPLLVRPRDVDGRVERVRPVDVGGVEVRVRHADGGDAAERLDVLAGRVVEHRHAVPQHVALRRLHQERPLPDRDRRLGADPQQARLLLAPVVRGGLEQLGHRRPALAAVPDVLALVEADRALCGRFARCPRAAPRRCGRSRRASVGPLGRQEPFHHQVAYDGKGRAHQLLLVLLEELGQGREDLAQGQLAVAGADQRGLDGVDLCERVACRAAGGARSPRGPRLPVRRTSPGAGRRARPAARRAVPRRRAPATAAVRSKKAATSGPMGCSMS